MHLKIVLLFFLFLFSIVNSAENGDALAEESVIEKLHKANSVVSIAVSNALVSDPIAAATTIANYALFCGVLNLSEHLFLRCQKKEETNAFHKLVQASLYFAASKCITDIVCGPCHSAHLSMFYGSTFLILAGLNGYCKIDEAILGLARRKVDQVRLEGWIK
ncbi:MAG: hypothetical protein WCJ92_06670 [Alphaproteobacteria bacterium]